MVELPEDFRFEYAPEILVELHRAMIEEIILHLFQLTPDEYTISDESLLSDFVDYFDHDAEYNEAIAKLNALYGTEFSPNESYYLYEVAMKIKGLKNSKKPEI